MFTFTVDMPNGFTVNLDEEKQRNSGAQLVEMDQDKVNVYYDNVSPWFGFLHSFLTLYWLFSILCILNCVEASTSEVEVSRRILGYTPLYSCDSFYLTTPVHFGVVDVWFPTIPAGTEQRALRKTEDGSVRRGGRQQTAAGLCIRLLQSWWEVSWLCSIIFCIDYRFRRQCNLLLIISFLVTSQIYLTNTWAFLVLYFAL